MLERGITLAAHTDYCTISDLVRVHACPVRYYYERHETLVESDRYAVCKQLSYHLGTPLEADAIWQEVAAVRPGIDSSLRELLDISIAACNKTAWKPASETDVRVVSDIQKLAGMIDRIDGEGTFSIIRASGALPFGAYAADRLRVAAIALCLEEMTGSEVKGGHIEYIPDGVSRFHEVQPRDRRQVIATLKKLREIREGAMPQHPLNAPCNRCRHQEKCESSVGKRLSELL
ncbi:Dna2/Cas4 domain-containing protein [Methanoregula sp.]|uniref:CRISPR-associated protein Cas4 n=1 Tax=Methanoregula sp. TaxID=2052170 RepID=UPI000CA7765E|nr:Dna2/Cas4 domain-containing protein [Methanoregula sp.]PKG32575.1 MAG: recombinase RecB [Methanoregula sp.]